MLLTLILLLTSENKEQGRDWLYFLLFPYFLEVKSIIMWTKNGKDAQIYKDESFFPKGFYQSLKLKFM